MVGSVGIFSGIPSSRGSWTILVDSTSLAGAEPYGDFLTHPYGHYEVWSNWQRPRRAPTTDSLVINAIREHEYEHFPRGRIVYHAKARLFIVYADRRLQQTRTIVAIATKFGLSPGSFIVRTGEHCRS
jgi:hypothetical protein